MLQTRWVVTLAGGGGRQMRGPRTCDPVGRLVSGSWPGSAELRARGGAARHAFSLSHAALLARCSRSGTGPSGGSVRAGGSARYRGLVLAFLSQTCYRSLTVGRGTALNCSSSARWWADAVGSQTSSGRAGQRGGAAGRRGTLESRGRWTRPALPCWRNLHVPLPAVPID